MCDFYISLHIFQRTLRWVNLRSHYLWNCLSFSFWSISCELFYIYLLVRIYYKGGNQDNVFGIILLLGTYAWKLFFPFFFVSYLISSTSLLARWLRNNNHLSRIFLTLLLGNICLMKGVLNFPRNWPRMIWKRIGNKH